MCGGGGGGGMCMYLFVQEQSSVYAHICTHVEARIFSFYTIFFEIGFLTEPGAH